MTKNESTTYLFEQMPIPGAVAKLAVPMVIANLVTIVYNLADTFFVGMLNDPVQNAAVTLVYPVILAFYAVTNLFGIGTSSMMSRSLGRKDYERTRNCSVFGFYGAFFCAAALALLCTIFKTPLLGMMGADSGTTEAASAYLLWTVSCGAVPAILNVVQGTMIRSEGASLHAGIGTMSGCILNIILDPIFILPWGLGLGAAGAGLATFLSNCFATCYFLVLTRIKRGKTFVSLDIRRLKYLNREVVLGILGVGVPASIQNLMNVTGSTILNNFTAVYGAAAVAAMGIGQKLHSIPMQMVFGFTQGIMPLVSYNYASGNRQRMKKTIIFGLGLVIPVMTTVTLCFWIFSPQLIRLFMDNEEIMLYGPRLLRGLCLSLLLLSIDFTAVGVFQALGRGHYALVFAVMRKLLLEIPLLYILNAVLPLYGLAYAQTGAELVLAAAALIMLRRILREKPDPLKTE